MAHKVRPFAMLRERAGCDTVEVQAPDGVPVSELITRLADQYPVLRPLIDSTPMVVAVNREYAKGATPVRAGDELALIPPVSGGAG